MLEFYGYKYVEVPTIVPLKMFEACTEGTENKMFELSKDTVLIPEVTNYIRSMGRARLGTDKLYYVAKCFRNESTTDKERLREFTQVGVELLGENSLNCRKVVRRDAIKIFKEFLESKDWTLDDNVERGLNLYDDTGKTFEISSAKSLKQILGGGPYDGGAGWALGVERLMVAMETK